MENKTDKYIHDKHSELCTKCENYDKENSKCKLKIEVKNDKCENYIINSKLVMF